MPEVGYHYTGAEKLLPRGNQMARGHAMAWRNDAHGIVMGKAHANLILDTRIYQDEFAGGKATELTANIIVESMYAQYDADWN